MDAYSFGLVILTLLISCLMVMSDYKVVSFSFYLFVNLVLCLFLIFIFSVVNMFVMYLFFEFSLIPLMILIFGWGYQPERLISGLYLFFYTLFASLPLFSVIVYFYFLSGSLFFDIDYGYGLGFLVHFSMVFAFLVSFPMFMVHFWLPSAHVQAPVSGSMILAGLMLSIGGYGIIRFMFIYEFLFVSYSFVWYSFSIFGSLMVSFVCLLQGDVKCLIAYSSVAHMGMSMVGLLTMSVWGISGSYLLMVGHGLCSSGLFFLANISYDRLLSRSFFINKGMLIFMPSMSFMWFIFCCFNMGCPPSISFLSEIMVINSMIAFCSFSFYYLFFISFFGSCFSFYLFSYTQHGFYHNLYCFFCGTFREYLVLFSHLVPMLFFSFFLDFVLY